MPPARFEPHDVIGEPDMVGPEMVFQPFEFGDHILGIARVVALAPDGLGAPVAVVGTTAGGDHVHRVVTVAGEPDLPIAVHVDQVPGWEGQSVQVLDVVS